MKQGLRLLFKPGTFFGQLQWSTHHWFILFAFLAIASVETQLGKFTDVYQTYALLLQNQFSLTFDQALWVITFSKLGLMLLGTYVLVTFIWIVGNLLGAKKSKRVLFRRLAVVFAVFLAGYTAQHMTEYSPHFLLAAVLLYSWGLFLGYFAIREQFELTVLETTIVSLFAVLLVSSSWHYSTHIAEAVAKNQVSALVKPQPVDKRIFR